MRVNWSESPEIRKYHPESQRTVQWSPEQFLGAVPQTRINRKTVEAVKEAIKQGEVVETVWVDLDVTTGEVTNHEGRHRATALKELGVKSFPVIQFLKKGGRLVSGKAHVAQDLSALLKAGGNPHQQKQPWEMTKEEYNQEIAGRIRLPNSEGGAHFLPIVYIRLGDLPASNQPSMNWSKSRLEKGVSVFRAWKDPKTGKYILDNLDEETVLGEADFTGDSLIHDKRNVIEVAGNKLEGYGGSGEDLLDPNTVRIIVGDIDPESAYYYNDGVWNNLRGEPVSSSELPDFRNAKGGLKHVIHRSEVKRALAAGKLVSQEVAESVELLKEWEAAQKSARHPVHNPGALFKAVGHPHNPGPSDEANLQRVVEEGGGDYLGIQEGIGPVQATVLFNDAAGLTESTMSLRVSDLSVERVRQRIQQKREEVPAEPHISAEYPNLKGCHPVHDLQALLKAAGNPHEVVAETPENEVYVHVDDLKEVKSWGQVYNVHKESLETMSGALVTKDQLPSVLYHVTTNAPAIEADGFIRSMMDGNAGLGKGTSFAHHGVSVTTELEDAKLIKRELLRRGQMARQEQPFPEALKKWAEEDERIAGIPKGALDAAVSEGVWRYNTGMEMSKRKDPAEWAFDASNLYLFARERLKGPQNPIIFGRPEAFVRVSPENTKIFNVDPEVIPDNAVIRVNPLGSTADPLHEVMIHAAIPIRSDKQ